MSELHESRGSQSETLDTIVSWATLAVDATDAGLFLLRAKRAVETVVPSSPQVARVHDLQIELNEGPCIEVLAPHSVGTFLVGDTASDRRFPAWGPQAAELGLRSVISAILETPNRQYGSLNVYSSQPQAFTRDDLETIEIFSHRAARAIAVASEHAGMVAALHTRKLVGQAQGILMERLNIDGDRAFNYLVRQSQTRNIKLRDVAEWIVANRQQPLDDMNL